MGSVYSALRLERQPTSCRRSIWLQMVYRYQIGQQFVASGAARAQRRSATIKSRARAGFCHNSETARAAFAEPSQDVYVAAK